MYAVIQLPDFAMQAALRHEPDLWPQPVALVDSALAPPRVCAVTDAARAAGVAEGLTQPQTQARCRGAVFRRRSPAQEAGATEVLLQCAFGFSPRVENTGPGLCALDLRDLAELKDADEAVFAKWAARLRQALLALGLRSSVGIGPTPNVARHASRRVDTAGIVVGDPAKFIAGLPVDTLAPSSDVSIVLRKWGIHTVGQLLALGQGELADRIGLEALALFAAASATGARPLSLAKPAERFEESFEFEAPVATVEPLLFLLRRFVDQISQRLELSRLAAELLVLRLRLESGGSIERRLRLPQPTREADTLFRTLSVCLETLRTESSLVAVALTAASCPSAEKQLGLFESALRDPRQFQETLARLSALLGSDRVGTPARLNGHRPDAFKMVSPDFENAPDALPRPKSDALASAPLRRLRPAAKAQVALEPEEKSPVGDSPAPTAIHSRAAHGPVKQARGPWRVSGNWWEPAAWRIEEWDVAMRDGVTIRLAKRPEGWFVEGILD
jgi:protein ImuB